MDVVQSRGGQHGARGPGAHAQIVETLGRGMLAALQPLLLASVTAERDGLARAIADGSAPAGAADDLANLNIIIGDITGYERQWRTRFSRTLQAWPRPAEAGEAAAFSLVSDDQLQGQLIGQPVIESLAHRHADILDALEKRLWTLAAAMGAGQRPDNPFSPRELVDAFLATFSPSDCGARLRAGLVRRFERLAGPRLGEAYDWCNRQLAEAGFALAGTSDYAVLAVTTAAPQRQAPHSARLQVWGADNAVEPVRTSWRETATDGPGTCGSIRGAALRHAARMRREQAAPPRAPGVRELRNEEFLAVLSLLQVDAVPIHESGAGYAAAARNALARAADRLGIDSATAVPSAGQEDVIDVVGGLFDALAAGHLLQPAARESLALLLLPFLRLALEEPRLFDANQPPAMRLLARVVELWDGNGGASAHEAQLHALADAAAREVAADYHGDAAAFDDALARLETGLAPLLRRASISERRAWQAIEGGERLEAAREAADREHAARVDGCPLLPAVAGFLQEHWRQALVQAWLRAGDASARFTDLAALGGALVRLDAAAARGEGAAVAAALIELQPKLHDCCLAAGLDGPAAEALIAKLVGELALPDTPRRRHPSTPLAQAAPAGGQGPPPQQELQPPRRFVQAGAGGPPRPLRLAWRSPLSGAFLLVNAQGTREYLLDGSKLASMMAGGQLLLRPVEDPVEFALRQLERA